jgi:hypothetical protein
VETLSARLVRRFALLGTQRAEMTVPAGAIVERIDVVGQLGDRQLSVLVDLLLDPFLLEAAEEGLRDGIDAPMSSRRLRRSKIRKQQRIKFTDDIAFKAPTNLRHGAAFLGTFC